ncbi:MAG: type VI secretion system baseplate subunit TssG [Burkholderiales bacterium]|nr:type VI secretion system baseplate subunit TssG [Burkholderiales bacterium]
MPAQERIRPAAVIERLLEQPQAFGFFQALRLLERHNAQVPAGQAIAVRFRNSLAVGFPASEIEAVEALRRAPKAGGQPASSLAQAAQQAQPASATSSGPAPASRACLASPPDARPPAEEATALAASTAPQALPPLPPLPAAADAADKADTPAWDTLRVTPAFMSLLGVHGALPLAYTEKVASRETYQRDRAPRAFLDIFFDRLCVLMHEAWKKYRPALRYEADPRDEFTPLVLALAGLGGPALRDRLADAGGGVQDESLAYYAAALRQRPPSADWMGRVAADYFGVPIRVEPFVGRWYAIPPEHRAVLGASAGLGTQSVIGERVYQRDLALRLHIGPLAESDYQRFLPGGSASADLGRLLGLMTGASFEYEVRLSLQPEAVQPARLGGSGRLGWDAFVLSRPAAAARSDAGYAISPLGEQGDRQAGPAASAQAAKEPAAKEPVWRPTGAGAQQADADLFAPPKAARPGHAGGARPALV